MADLRKTKDPMFSIIVPIYNTEKYLGTVPGKLGRTAV